LRAGLPDLDIDDAIGKQKGFPGRKWVAHLGDTRLALMSHTQGLEETRKEGGGDDNQLQQNHDNTKDNCQGRDLVLGDNWD